MSKEQIIAQTVSCFDPFVKDDFLDLYDLLENERFDYKRKCLQLINKYIAEKK